VLGSQFSGTFTQEADEDDLANCPTGGVCAGDLVTCSDGERIVISTTTFYSLGKACDDAGFPTCGGRFTGFNERCFDPTVGSGDVKRNGSILSVNSRGETRICFSNLAAWPDCTNATKPPDGIVIFEGDVRAQVSFDLVVGGPAHVIAEVIRKTSNPFRDPADGQVKQLKARVIISHITSQRDTGCGTPGSASCGFAGSGVRP